MHPRHFPSPTSTPSLTDTVAETIRQQLIHGRFGQPLSGPQLAMDELLADGFCHRVGQAGGGSRAGIVAGMHGLFSSGKGVAGGPACFFQ